MLYVAIWYVSIRPVVMRVKEELQSLEGSWTSLIARLYRLYQTV